MNKAASVWDRLSFARPFEFESDLTPQECAARLQTLQDNNFMGTRRTVRIQPKGDTLYEFHLDVSTRNTLASAQGTLDYDETRHITRITGRARTGIGVQLYLLVLVGLTLYAGVNSLHDRTASQLLCILPFGLALWLFIVGWMISYRNSIIEAISSKLTERAPANSPVTID